MMTQMTHLTQEYISQLASLPLSVILFHLRDFFARAYARDPCSVHLIYTFVVRNIFLWQRFGTEIQRLEINKGRA
jgi:hypothetical protein